MRFSIRRLVQAIFISSFLATVNLLFILIRNGEVDSNGGVAKVWAQNSPLKDGGMVVNPGPKDTDDILARDAKSGRRVSSLTRHQRDLERQIMIATSDGTSENKQRPIGGKVGKTPPKGPKAKPRRFNRPTELDDIFISVKTTQKFHRERLDLLAETWMSLARDQTYIFSDAEDSFYRKKMKGHFINTNCSSVHSRRALCCKMALEYDYFMDSNKRWFCHVDDDTYVNIPALLKLLQQYNHTDDWYLGKPSLNHPIELAVGYNPQQKIAFWFATGGAGMCISRGLALKMMPYASGGKLMTVGEKIRLPDDCTIGYIINYILKKELTVVNSFHSHLEGLWLVRAADLQNHITFSYSKYGAHWNIVNMPYGFNTHVDPTRFKSIHCHLYPYLKGCPTPGTLR